MQCARVGGRERRDAVKLGFLAGARRRPGAVSPVAGASMIAITCASIGDVARAGGGTTIGWTTAGAPSTRRARGRGARAATDGLVRGSGLVKIVCELSIAALIGRGRTKLRRLVTGT